MGGSVLGRVSDGELVFWREGSTMDLDADGWTAWKSEPTDSFLSQVSEPWVHRLHCLRMHPLVAPTILTVVARTFMAEVIEREPPEALGPALTELASLVPWALAADGPSEPPTMTSDRHGLVGPRRSLADWARAVRTALTGETERRR